MPTYTKQFLRGLTYVFVVAMYKLYRCVSAFLLLLLLRLPLLQKTKTKNKIETIKRDCLPKLATDYFSGEQPNKET